MNFIPPYNFNSPHRCLSPHKSKKKFCSHKILADFEIKLPPLKGGGGGGGRRNHATVVQKIMVDSNGEQ